jgi:mannose-6-phosphate isomerase
MFSALTTFEGLCGFRPYGEVCTYLETVPELKTAVGLEESSSFISACKGELLLFMNTVKYLTVTI